MSWSYSHCSVGTRQTQHKTEGGLLLIMWTTLRECVCIVSVLSALNIKATSTRPDHLGSVSQRVGDVMHTQLQHVARFHGCFGWCDAGTAGSVLTGRNTYTYMVKYSLGDLEHISQNYSNAMTATASLHCRIWCLMEVMMLLLTGLGQTVLNKSLLIRISHGW